MSPDNKPSATELLKSEVRRAIISCLTARQAAQVAPDSDAARGLTAAELSSQLNIHVTTARFHLDQLEKSGMIYSQNVKHGTAGRPKKTYFATGGNLAENDQSEAFKALQEILLKTTENVDLSALEAVSPEEAGFMWGFENTRKSTANSADLTPAATPGTWLGKIGLMIDNLESWGYQPNVSLHEGGHTANIALARCPFLSLAKSKPEVICAVHRGLIRGALSAMAENNVAISLEPFVTPTQCLAHITTKNPFGGKSS